jgi:hypothetical protein
MDFRKYFRLASRPVAIFTLCLVVFAESIPAQRIELHMDSDEAVAVLAIVNKHLAGKQVPDSDWQRLFATEPYIRLKRREAAMHRDFSDEEFKSFVFSDELGKQAPVLESTLRAWQKADLIQSARRVLTYWPEQAYIRAKVFPVIKPTTNSFVFETETDPAIFLYLDPKST